jgi:hypothetical protein
VQLNLRKILLGLLAGFLSAPTGLLLAYVVGVIVTAIKTREVLTTLLVAGSFLPLMLIFVLLIPTLLISIIVGLALGVASGFDRRLLIPIGIVVGLSFGEIIISVILPAIVAPQPDDFTSIVSDYRLSAIYGLVLGTIAAVFLRWFSRGSKVGG